MFAVINLLYFTNLIPPIPLSLKDSGVYHNVQRDSTGNYVVENENKGWRGYFEFYKVYHQVYGDPVFAYSAVFSPTNLNTTVIHEWQHYDVRSAQWVVQNTVDLPVIGGRGNGFRTFSVRNNLVEGKWIVNVLTNTGQLVGRLRFKIEDVPTNPALQTIVKQ